MDAILEIFSNLFSEGEMDGILSTLFSLFQGFGGIDGLEGFDPSALGDLMGGFSF